ncbi:hypothetical protein B0T40_09715 [Chromobacterium haemolyticum]|uniref:transcriptional regulator n=1 Tax=Chromobacterium haemolyticum TaxID=394935 RepID=UPI0009DAEF36|nr:helix-turn-helix domain-containing protein [Chromobacterium haemolyticum]OQS36662.1 hypothetical protein B0T40_09715 [Chromobacterium haemolyticum]
MKQTTSDPVEKLFALLGGPTGVARRFELTPWAVSKWRSRVPADRCIELEKLTQGKVRCEDLRPDIDWGYLRGTPSKSSKSLPIGGF